jgi:dephospho-CoA kinase
MLARPAVAQALGAEFGADVLDPEGRVRRDVLGPRAFASDGALARLNAIVHPPLLAEIEAILAACGRAAIRGLVVIDAALLVEWDAGRWCDLVVAVLSSPARQVERLVRERGRTPEQARDLVARQLPNEARAAYADVVLWNDGTLEEFRAAARAVAAQVRERAHGLPGSGSFG